MYWQLQQLSTAGDRIQDNSLSPMPPGQAFPHAHSTAMLLIHLLSSLAVITEAFSLLQSGSLRSYKSLQKSWFNGEFNVAPMWHIPPVQPPSWHSVPDNTISLQPYQNSCFFYSSPILIMLSSQYGAELTTNYTLSYLRPLWKATQLFKAMHAIHLDQGSTFKHKLAFTCQYLI